MILDELVDLNEERLNNIRSPYETERKGGEGL